MNPSTQEVQTRKNDGNDYSGNKTQEALQKLKGLRYNFRSLKSKLGEDLFSEITNSNRNVTDSILYDCNNPKYLNYNSFPVSAPEIVVERLKKGFTCNKEKVWRSKLLCRGLGCYATLNIEKVRLGIIFQPYIDKVMSKNACKEYFTFMGHPFYNRVTIVNEPKELNELIAWS